MIYFTFRTKKGHEDCDVPWHIGQRLPGIDKDLANVVEVQADGHELDLIKAHFRNIPMSESRVVVWTGETAQFIYNNFPPEKSFSSGL